MGIWGARVLVVDDDSEGLELAQRLLRAGGADVITVPTAGEALATVIGVTPDVIVVDASMAGLDAAAFLRAIRVLSPEKGGQVPVILVAPSAVGAPDPDPWQDAAFQGHLTPCFAPGDLVRLVARFAGRAVERRRRALDRRHWPRDVNRERRVEVRDEPPLCGPDLPSY